MNTPEPPKNRKRCRVTLTARDLEHLFEIHATRSVAQIARRSGLAYMQIYNLVHRRVRSVSQRQYAMLFGSPVPAQAPLKVDGAAFRQMADLWLYLNEGVSRADLYRALFGLSEGSRADHRIFSGRVATVDARIEHALRKKFLAAGVDGPLLAAWLKEFGTLPASGRVPYETLRPTLVYLKETLGIHPATVLRQAVARYESGMLRSVPRHIAERAEALKRAAERSRRQRRTADATVLRESVLGGKEGYTLYSDIREELLFIARMGGRSAKSFLGRSTWTYEHGKARRIADWRARNIMAACDDIIRHHPTLRLSALPPSRQRQQLGRLLAVLTDHAGRLLGQQDDIDLEREILRPARRRDAYGDPTHGFTPFEMASGVLGMRRRAFDLMVARNCEIFRTVGKRAQRWYLSDLYLRELSKKKAFRLILAKYERMADSLPRHKTDDTCLK